MGYLQNMDQENENIATVERKTNDTSSTECKKPITSIKKQSSQPKRKNTSIYIKSLPNDVTVDEIYDYFSRCGIIMESLYEADQPRIKIYYDDEGIPKGDALVTYLKEESVLLAVSMFDQSQFRPGCIITVEPAVFSQTQTQAAENTSLDKHQLKASFDRMKRKLEWGSANQLETAIEDPLPMEKVVLLKGMFNVDELNTDPSVSFDIKAEVMEECNEKYGKVSNVKIYPNLPGGLMTVKFKDGKSARDCIAGLNGRWFDGRKVVACIYDGILKDEEVI